MKRLNLLLFNIFLIPVFFTGLHAQNPLSLDQIIEIAVEQNYSLRIVRNNALIASANYSPGNAGLLPSVDLNSSFSGNLNNTNQNYSDGTQAEIRGIHNTTANAGVQAGWMLYNGLRGRIRYQQLEELKNLSELSTRISIENLVANIASEYYYYIQQQRLFSNLQYAVNLSKERVRIEQEHFLLGSGSKISLSQAEVNLNADSSRLQRQYEVLSASSIRLAELMAAEDLSETFVPADTSIVINNTLTYDALLPYVMDQNAAIIAARNQYTLSEFDLRLVRSNRLPYLNLTSGYGYTHNTFQNSTLSSQQTWGLNYRLSLGVNIYDGSNQKRLTSNARIQLENDKLSLDRTTQQITADFLTVFNAYTNNINLLGLETLNLEVARENLDIAFERYRLGSLSGFELRELQKDLLEAEERLLSIQYQAKMAEISLLQLSGRILDQI